MSITVRTRNVGKKTIIRVGVDNTYASQTNQIVQDEYETGAGIGNTFSLSLIRAVILFNPESVSDDTSIEAFNNEFMFMGMSKKAFDVSPAVSPKPSDITNPDVLEGFLVTSERTGTTTQKHIQMLRLEDADLTDELIVSPSIHFGANVLASVAGEYKCIFEFEKKKMTEANYLKALAFDY